MPSKAHLTRSHSNSKSHAKNGASARRDFSSLVARARVVTIRCIYMRWFFLRHYAGSLLLCFPIPRSHLLYRSSLLIFLFALEGNRGVQTHLVSFRFSLLSLLRITKKTRSSSRRRRRAWCSLRLLFLLFLFCLFVVGLQTSSFHSFRPFHRRHDPVSNDRHAFEPRTFCPRPMRQSFPPLAQREEEERHHALQRHAAAPEAHDRHSSSFDERRRPPSSLSSSLSSSSSSKSSPKLFLKK